MGDWFSGTVTRDRGGHMFDIDYDDGDSEIGVDIFMLRLIGEEVIGTFSQWSALFFICFPCH
jgi:hypothetical protein